LEKEITTSNVLDEWGNEYQSVRRWLSKIQRKNDATFDLYRFCKWAQMSPDELLALKEDPKSMEAETLLDDFKISDEYTLSVRRRILINVKSFFKGNYKGLAAKAGIVDEYVKQKPYHKLTKEDIYKLWRMCFNPRDRFLLSLVFSSGIAKESIIKITWGHLEGDWEKQRIVHISLEPEIIKGHGRGKYKGVRQETFLAPSAKRDLLEYKAWIEEKLGRPVTKDDPLILTTEQPYEAISYTRLTNIFISLQKRTGVMVSPHDARRYVENALESANIHINRCRKIRGRKIKGEEDPYSQPAIEELRIDYAKALDDLEFQIEKPAIKPEDVRKEIINAIPDEEIKPIADKYGISISEARHMVILRESAFRDFWSERRKRKQTERNGGNDSGETFEEINEEDLLTHLRSGWKIVHINSQTGKVIISR